MTKGKTIKAWHFLPESRMLRYGDGRKIVAGRWLSCGSNSLKMCHRGMHASKNILDALYYAPGPIICRVELGGKILHGDDKMCAERRRVLWWIDGTEVLRKFARMCALDVVHLWDAPEVVVKHLKTGDEKIRDTARDAAWNAAYAAWVADAYAAHAAYAAVYAARDAAGAASYAARDAAAYAAWAAAGDAAGAAARAAARDAARDAGAAAYAAVRDAATKKQARRLGILVHKAMRKKYNR